MDGTLLLSTLFVLAAVAGLIDSIAGGGGLITVPALLWAGLPPLNALATNKAQGVFGTFAATLGFIRQGAIDLRGSLFFVGCTLVGAIIGTLSVRYLDDALLEALIPGLLVVFALYFLFSPRVADVDSKQRLSGLIFGLAVCTAIGFYDGFFGPGTGTFFAIGLVALMGYNLTRATAHTKLLNFTSNLSALFVFWLGGHIVWEIALVMGVGQALGGWVGAHLVSRHGARLVRPLLVVVSVSISIKLLLD